MALVFASGLPVSLVSWKVLQSSKVPSAAFSLYVGLGLTFVFMGGLVGPRLYGGLTFVTRGTFFFLLSPLWVVLVTFQMVMKPRLARSLALAWSLNSAALGAFAFLCYTFLLDNVPDSIQHDLQNLLMGLVSGIVPLALAGVALQNGFLYGISMCGIITEMTHVVIIISGLNRREDGSTFRWNYPSFHEWWYIPVLLALPVVTIGYCSFVRSGPLRHILVAIMTQLSLLLCGTRPDDDELSEHLLPIEEGSQTRDQDMSSSTLGNQQII